MITLARLDDVPCYLNHINGKENLSEKYSAIVKKVFLRPDYFLAYGCGSGLVPKAPGTAGTVLGILLWSLFQYMPVMSYLLTIVAMTFIGIYVSDRVSKDLGESDPSGIVIDEICGILITLFMIPHQWYWVLAGFLVFRILDILKPWPISFFDTRIKGGLGIMADDIVAGLIGLALIQFAVVMTAGMKIL